ncbi:hypothetical protein GCM10010510_34100 [Streptomyces anandii JCM 4720]|nr:hypothetical protein GCM10010510_34100 [Streptomyces anandii JCM 4720]
MAHGATPRTARTRAPHAVGPPIASGAGGRFALAGAKCERRLPARYGPAPEVRPSHASAPRGRRPADTPTCVYADTETADTVSGASRAGAWWDVSVAETATRSSAAGAHELYERHVSTRRRHLRRSYRA